MRVRLAQLSLQRSVHTQTAPLHRHVALPSLLQLKWYTVEVQYCGEVVGTGSGWERRWAEQAAARQALDNMGQLPGQEVPGDVALEGQ